jgi:hypothetical protein
MGVSSRAKREGKINWREGNRAKRVSFCANGKGIRVPMVPSRAKKEGNILRRESNRAKRVSFCANGDDIYMPRVSSRAKREGIRVSIEYNLVNVVILHQHMEYPLTTIR